MESDQDNTTNDNMTGDTVGAVSSDTNTMGASDGSTMQRTPMNTGGDLVFRNHPKKNTGMILAMVLFLILAAGGIGFGVWAMMDGNSRVEKKDKEISDLQSQLAEKSGTVVEDDTVVDDDGDGTTSENATDTSGYIYVGEWGLKIKKPTTNIVDNKMQDGSIATVDYAVDGSRLYVWGTVYREGDQAAMGDHMRTLENKIEVPYLIEIAKVHDDCFGGEKIGELSDGMLCYTETPESVLIEAFNESVMEKYVKPTMSILKDTLANIDNYQKI